MELIKSSHSIKTTHYLLKKYMDEKDLREILSELLDLISVVPVDIDNIKKGLRSIRKDFADAIQIFCAHSIENIDSIVTRN